MKRKRLIYVGYTLIFLLAILSVLQIHLFYDQTRYSFEDGQIILKSQTMSQFAPWHYDELRDTQVVTKLLDGQIELLYNPLFIQKIFLYATLLPFALISPQSLIFAYTFLPALNFLVFLVSLAILLFHFTKNHLVPMLVLLPLPLATNNSLVTGFWFYTGFSLALTILMVVTMLLFVRKKSKNSNYILLVALLILLALSQGSVFFIVLFYLAILILERLLRLNNLLAKKTNAFSLLRHGLSTIIVFLFIIFIGIMSHIFELTQSPLLENKFIHEFISNGPFSSDSLTQYITPVTFFAIVPLWSLLLATVGILGLVYAYKKTSFKRRTLSNHFLTFVTFLCSLWVLVLFDYPLLINSNKLAYLLGLITIGLSGYGLYVLFTLLSKIVDKKKLIHPLRIAIFGCLFLVIFFFLFTAYGHLGEIDDSRFFLHDYYDEYKIDLLGQIDTFAQVDDVRLLTDFITYKLVPQFCESCYDFSNVELFSRSKLVNSDYHKWRHLRCNNLQTKMIENGYDFAIVSLDLTCADETVLAQNEKYQLITS